MEVSVLRNFVLASALLFAAPALACPMADAAAFAEAAEKVKASDGTKLTLSVEGMSCGDCSEKLTAALQKVKGVVAAAADYQTGRTEISYDADKTAVDALIAEVAKLGYKAKVANT
jgi:copper chaperone